MTANVVSDKRGTMLRHGWLLLIVLFALASGATVHAREVPGAAAISCSGEVHVDGDADQVRDDADQNVPHHHGGCHGHVLALQPAGSSSALCVPAACSAFAARPAALRSRAIDPALRPPSA